MAPGDAEATCGSALGESDRIIVIMIVIVIITTILTLMI